MFSIMKELFSPKMIVGLKITASSIGAVQIFNALKGPEVNRIAFGNIDNPEGLTDELKDLFQKEDFYSSTLITSVASSDALIRYIPVTIGNRKKLSKIIKYQAEPYLPQSIEEMIVDFLADGKDEALLAVAVEKAIVSEHLKELSKAGLEPEVVSLEDTALYSLYSFQHPENNDRATCILHLGEKKNSVLIVYKNMLDFIRVLPPEKNFNKSILETLDLYKLKRPDTPFGDILLTGISANNDDLAKSMASIAETEPRIWRPFDGFKHGLGNISDDLQTRLSVPLGSPSKSTRW